MNKEIKIHEVGPRDGLQVEKKVVPLKEKIKWIEKIMESGVDIIQVGSFVHLEKMPQMADTDKLFTYFTGAAKKPDNIILSGLVLNEKGLERGLTCGVEQFCMGVSASNTHSRKNTGMSTEEATDRIIAMAGKAQKEGKKVQLSVQSAFGCGFEGLIPEKRVINIVKKYLDSGFTTISLADTAGHANPVQVENLFGIILQLAPQVELACHFHNTYGMGMANCYAALKSGVKYFETAFGGIGGCPFTAVTGGNVTTEDFVHMAHLMNIRNDIKIEKLIDVSKEASLFFNRELPGVIYRTGVIKHNS